MVELENNFTIINSFIQHTKVGKHSGLFSDKCPFSFIVFFLDQWETLHIGFQQLSETFISSNLISDTIIFWSRRYNMRSVRFLYKIKNQINLVGSTPDAKEYGFRGLPKQIPDTQNMASHLPLPVF